jgi:16S rRNA (cytidine1402-2'-O)-methyltransferase
MTEKSSALYVVPTPLGHLGDMTQRAIEVLRQVPWVAAEDTRHSAPLLRHYGCTARLLAAHQHNEEEAAQQVITRLAAGESVALVVDAGTPGISDPGARLVARVRAAGHCVVPLPGACAAIVALSAAGLAETHFLFYGFLPSKSAQRAQALREIAHLPYALVFYEAPHRILESVDALLTAFGPERTIVLARELTKLFESIHGCALGEAHLPGCGPMSIASAASSCCCSAGSPPIDADAEGERVLQLLLADGLSVSQASRLAHSISGSLHAAFFTSVLWPCRS